MQEDGFEVTHLCDALNVHRNGYYQWTVSTENIYQKQDLKLAPMVQDIFFQHRRRYGARRISIELKAEVNHAAAPKPAKSWSKRDL